jgi:hypothetical protein
MQPLDVPSTAAVWTPSGVSTSGTLVVAEHVLLNGLCCGFGALSPDASPKLSGFVFADVRHLSSFFARQIGYFFGLLSQPSTRLTALCRSKDDAQSDAYSKPNKKSSHKPP